MRISDWSSDVCSSDLFENDFPGAKVIRLERNYRSTGRILAAASGLIAHNEGRLGKTLWTEDEEGEKLRLRGLWDGEAEARFVGEEIEALVARAQNPDPQLIPILVRPGAQPPHAHGALTSLRL